MLNWNGIKRLTSVSLTFGVVALGAVACANTSGGTAAADTATGGGTDTTGGGTDAASGGDTAGGSDTTGGTDSQITGTEATVAQIQSAASSAQCTDESKIQNTQNGLTIHHAVVVSPLRKSTTKGGKELEGLFVQDKGGGKNSGIYLTGDSPGPLADLKVGDLVTITGDVKEFYCYTEMEPIAVTKEGTMELPAATTLDTALVATAVPVADKEAWEGVLVSLQGVTVSDNAVIGTDGKPHNIYVGKDQADKALMIGNGFFNYMQAKDGTPNYKVGQKLNIVGVLEYSFAAYSITPITVEVAK